MVDINPFQAGQQFETRQVTAEQLLLERQRREKGINALANMFDDTALAPAERASVFATERAEEAFAATEEQRVLENQRQAIIDQRVQEEADLKDRTTAALRLVGFFEQGVKNNVPFEILAQTAGPTMQAIGIPDEETSAIIQRISEDPATVLPQIRASLTAGQPRPRGQPGRLVPGVVAGKDVFIRGLPGGGFETLEGVAPITPAIQRERLALTEAGLGIRVSEADRKILNDIRDEKKTLREGRTFAEATVAAAQTVTRDITDLVELLPLGKLTEEELRAQRGKDNPVFAASRVAQSLTFGTDEFNQKKLIDSVKSNIAIDSLLRIKKSGAGLGQVPQTQLILLQSLLGNLDISRDPPLLLQNIRDVQERYTEVIRLMGTRDKTLEKRERELAARRDKVEKRLFGDREPREGAPQRFIFNRTTGLLEPR